MEDLIQALRGLLSIADESDGIFGQRVHDDSADMLYWEDFPEVEEARKVLAKHDLPQIVEEYSFEDFWDDYDKKVGSKPKLLKKWAKISKKDKQKIREYIPLYKAAQPDKKYRKNPETFLNNESWNDEIIGAKKSIPDNYKRELLEELLA
mgnify:CR=1 FL=1